MIFVNSVKHLSDFVLWHRRQVLYNAVMELSPTNTSVSVVIHRFELFLEVAYQLSIYEVVRNVGHDGCLELVHLAKLLQGVKITPLK